MKIYLGCGQHVLEGWENLDPRTGLDPQIKLWRWNEPLPYPDGSAELVLVQHSLQHCRPEDYDSNFREAKRVLIPGGRIVVKEADNRYRVWHHPGYEDRDGMIKSSISEPEAMAILVRNGFEEVTNDKDLLLGRYASVVTRLRKAGSRNYFIVEGTKPEV